MKSLWREGFSAGKVLFISLSICLSTEAIGQDFQSLRERAEIVVKAKRPSWKLLQKVEYEKQVSYSWGSVQKGIGLSIFYGASQKEAAERMEFKNKIISVGPGKKRDNLGDEAYYWEGSRGNFAGIRFRKANTYIEVTAPSLELAEEIARSLAKEIGKK